MLLGDRRSSPVGMRLLRRLRATSSDLSWIAVRRLERKPVSINGNRVFLEEVKNLQG